jgi:cystathionine gamma-synthase
MSHSDNLRFETLCIHAGLEASGDNHSIVPPISPGTIYEIHPDGRREGDFHYTRLDNPNRRQWENLIAALEGGEAAAAFSSGIAAASAVLQALNPGDHVLFPLDIYSGNRKLITQIMSRWGLMFDLLRWMMRGLSLMQYGKIPV